jgi:hypothetical protein
MVKSKFVKGKLVKFINDFNNQIDNSFKVEEKNKNTTTFISKMFGKVISSDEFTSGKYLKELNIEGFCFNTFHVDEFKDNPMMLLDMFNIHNNKFVLCYVNEKFVRFHADIIEELN